MDTGIKLPPTQSQGNAIRMSSTYVQLKCTAITWLVYETGIQTFLAKTITALI